MLSGGRAPTIRSVSNSGPNTRLSIGNVNKKINNKSFTDKKNGSENNNETETSKDDRLKGEKQGTETSTDKKIKAIIKNLQRIDDKSKDVKNTDPNAPINSENDPSRFDQVKGKEFSNSAEAAAARFGLYPPPQGKEAGFENLKSQMAGGAQAQAGGSSGVGGTGPGGGGFGTGGNHGGSNVNNGGATNNNGGTIGGPNQGGGGGGPIQGPGQGGGDPTNPAGITSREEVQHGTFRDINYQANSGQSQYFQDKYQDHHVQEIPNGDGTSQYLVHNPLDPGHNEPGHDIHDALEQANPRQNLGAEGLNAGQMLADAGADQTGDSFAQDMQEPSNQPDIPHHEDELDINSVA